jgi:serine protease
MEAEMSFAIVRSTVRSAAVLGTLAAAALMLAAAPRAAARAALTAEAPLEALREVQDAEPPAEALRWTGDRAEALMEALERGLGYVPGDVLVKFKPGTTIGGADRALSALRSRPGTEDLVWMGNVARLHDASMWDSRVLAATLSAQPEVLFAEPNYLYSLPKGEETPFTSEPGVGRAYSVPTLTPTDPSFGSRQWNFLEIGADRAWGINPGGSNNVIVAVIDSGITNVPGARVFPFWTGSSIANFSIPFAISPDLNTANLLPGRDFAFFSSPTAPVLDTSRHGTHVGSTIAEATNNGVGLAGLAYNVKLMPLKVCLSYWDVQIIRSNNGTPGFAPLGSGGCTNDGIAAAIRYAADNGARVANISLGGSSPAQVLLDALSYAVSKGTFFSISMGNEFEDGNPTGYPAQYAAAIDGAMSVAATGRSKTRAYYSSTGSHTEIAAPGGSLRDGSSGSGLIWQMINRTADTDTEVLIAPRFDRYDEVGFQGTSMASPHVAGLAALIVSQIPSATPAAIESILRRTAIDIGKSGRDDDFGFGLIQARPAIYGVGGRR